ncbi:Mak16 protein [Lanmaoa asiatica]|nr:Mak16 protein [Lanmaoa asiatica]
MQSDDVIWSVINTQFCSYKVKSVRFLVTTPLSKHLTTLPLLQNCNTEFLSKLAIRNCTDWGRGPFLGVLYLYVKTIERAHTPAKMWEKIPLSKNYSKALEQIDRELMYWPNFTIHKCKQRVTKITQYLIKMRRIKLRQEPKLVGVKKKLDRREATRERKALSAAHLEKSIEKELIERLKSKAYGDAPLNVNESVWQAILDQEKAGKEKEMEGERGLDMVDDETDGEDEDEEELEEEFGGEFVSDISGDEAELSDLSDLEDIVDEAASEEDNEGSDEEDDDTTKDRSHSESKVVLGKRKAKAPTKVPPRKKSEQARKGPRVEVEYEHELESIPITRSSLSNW